MQNGVLNYYFEAGRTAVLAQVFALCARNLIEYAGWRKKETRESGGGLCPVDNTRSEPVMNAPGNCNGPAV